MGEGKLGKATGTSRWDEELLLKEAEWVHVRVTRELDEMIVDDVQGGTTHLRIFTFQNFRSIS